MVAAAPATSFKNSARAMATNAMDTTVFSKSSREKFIAVVLNLDTQHLITRVAYFV